MLFFKKSVDLITFGLIATLLYGSVQADEHTAYLQLNAGAVFAQTKSSSATVVLGNNDVPRFSFDHDPGYVTGLALGYHLTAQFRLEGELMYQSNTLDYEVGFAVNPSTQHVNVERMRAAVLLNAYYDFKNNTAFTPYITAGIGGNHVEFKPDDGLPGLRNDFDVAYQVGAGVNYKLNDRFSLDVKYRYFSGAEPHFKNLDYQFKHLFELDDHQVMAGLRIGF